MELGPRISLLVLLVLVTACDTDKSTRTPSGATATSTSTASASASASASTACAPPPPVAVAKLKVGDTVEVCWRQATEASALDNNDTPFQCSVSVHANKAPWGDGEGGVDGAMLVAVLRAAVPTMNPKKSALHSVEPNKDPRGRCGGISLDDKEWSYFNNYVGVDAAGKLRVYVDVVAP